MIKLNVFIKLNRILVQFILRNNQNFEIKLPDESKSINHIKLIEFCLGRQNSKNFIYFIRAILYRKPVAVLRLGDFIRFDSA